MKTKELTFEQIVELHESGTKFDIFVTPSEKFDRNWEPGVVQKILAGKKLVLFQIENESGTYSINENNIASRVRVRAKQ